MGTTFVHAKPHADAPGFWMRDSILELWLRLLALHIEDPAAPPTLATSIRDRWLLASRGYFNGCVPHRLDEAVATPEGEAIIRAAIHSLLKSLAKAPVDLGPEVLNLMGFNGGEFVGRMETWRLVEVGQAFLGLLDGTVGESASSTAFMPGSSR